MDLLLVLILVFNTFFIVIPSFIMPITFIMVVYFHFSLQIIITLIITLLNQKLSSNKIIPLPNGNKNSAGAQKTYNTILKNLKKPKEIEECIAIAKESLKSKRALQTLKKFIELNQ